MRYAASIGSAIRTRVDGEAPTDSPEAEEAPIPAKVVGMLQD